MESRVRLGGVGHLLGWAAYWWGTLVNVALLTKAAKPEPPWTGLAQSGPGPDNRLITISVVRVSFLVAGSQVTPYLSRHTVRLATQG